MDTAVTAQTVARWQLGPGNSTGPVDRCIKRVRQMLESRAFCLRNQARTNLLLGLIRLHLNGVDDELTYYRLLRDDLTLRRGRPAPQRQLRDPYAGARAALAFAAGGAPPNVPSLRA